MSLILDALRRADSERERGAVPGLYAQPAGPATADDAPRPRTRPWHWIVVGLGVGLLVSVAGYLAGRGTQRPTSEPASTAATAAPTVPSAPSATVSPAPASVATQPQGEDRSQPVAEAAPWPQPESRNTATKTQVAVPAAAPEPKAEPAANAPTADVPVYTRDQLPENVRATLPPLTIGGSMYSANPANRSLVVNGGLYREHDQLTADLSLEQIKLKAAIFKYKGYRFEIQF